MSVKPGKIINKRLPRNRRTSDTPLYLCPSFGQAIDMRDWGELFHDAMRPVINHCLVNEHPTGSRQVPATTGGGDAATSSSPCAQRRCAAPNQHGRDAFGAPTGRNTFAHRAPRRKPRGAGRSLRQKSESSTLLPAKGDEVFPSRTPS